MRTSMVMGFDIDGFQRILVRQSRHSVGIIGLQCHELDCPDKIVNKVRRAVQIIPGRPNFPKVSP